MEQVKWLRRNRSYTKVSGEFESLDKLDFGVYNICFDPLSGWSLEKFADKFVFDYKIYGLETEFIEYAIKTYNNVTGNMGILMNGVRGSGKTVSAKILANRLELPIIVIKDMGDNNQGMIEYLGGFNFDCVLFFDEFEKNFSDEDSTVLQIMDGVYNAEYRKLFLLTTNELAINENLLDRPSRIRYVKQFKNLGIDIVKEYINDNLKRKEDFDGLLEYIDSLGISTIDTLKSIVMEVNIHGIETFKKTREFFNVSSLEYTYKSNRGILRLSELEDLKAQTSDPIDIFKKQVGLERKQFTCKFAKKDKSKLSKEEKKELEIFELVKTMPFRRTAITYLETNIKFKSLKVGDKLGREEENIKYIDTKEGVIITSPEYDDGLLYFHLISDTSVKPSLYSPIEESLLKF